MGKKIVLADIRHELENLHFEVFAINEDTAKVHLSMCLNRDIGRWFLAAHEGDWRLD